VAVVVAVSICSDDLAAVVDAVGAGLEHIGSIEFGVDALVVEEAVNVEVTVVVAATIWPRSLMIGRGAARRKVDGGVDAVS
jgi:hypothetical protein